MTLGDGFDMNPESAALQGYCRALGSQIILYSSNLDSMYSGPDYDTRRNLMLVHSADQVVQTLEELTAALSHPRLSVAG